MTLFFFGTLRDRALLETVIGRHVAGIEIRQAWAKGYGTRRVAGEGYPMLRHAAGEDVEGVLFTPLTEAERGAIAFYEEAEYGLSAITVETEAGPVEAQFFDATDKLIASDAPWDFGAWYGADGQGYDRLVALEAAAELMPLAQTVPVERIDDYWPAIMNRARQRATARLSQPVLGEIRQPFHLGEDVVFEAEERPFTGFFAVSRHTLRHRLFSGGMSAPLDRLTVAWGDAVTVLPYDAQRDRVLLIEQFRPGPAARRDPNPWCIEVPAGRIDDDAGVEAALRREALEEAGISLGRLHALPGYYPTPGLVTEHLSAWIGEADLSDTAGGLHGAAGEGEDIRTIVLGVDAAMAALRDGAVNTAPAQLLLLWLMLERPRLRRDWAGILGGD
ncbi:MAG: NUDIX domain-containing protein [Pseudomonadota bacterium]